MTADEKDILRRLAARVAEIAALPIQAERAALLRDLNALKPTRPVVLAFPEGGWRDLVPDSTLQCVDPLLRSFEMSLRQAIYQHEHFVADNVVTSWFNIRPAVRPSDYGLTEDRFRTEELGSYKWKPPLEKVEDLAKLHIRQIEMDDATSRQRVQAAQDAFGDLLNVRLHGSLTWTCGLTMTLIFLRGLDQVMYDMYDNPKFLHELMGLLMRDKLNEMETYERAGALTLNNGPGDYVGSGGLGATDQLPGADFSGKVRLKDLWGLGESQEFVLVGPEQFNEFALQYQLPILKKFGLVCYGCCEPLDHKFDLIIRQLPNLRRVSVSAWCDRSLAAEKLGNRYVYSWKPAPSMICTPTVNWDLVNTYTRETVQTARGCRLEMIMKDTHTFQGDPTRIERWSQIAMRAALEA